MHIDQMYLVGVFSNDWIQWLPHIDGDGEGNRFEERYQEVEADKMNCLCNHASGG